MSPWNMKNSVRKLESFGCNEVILTDRGTFFGYNQLVNDMTSLPIMRKIGYPVCFDATHSIQLPTSMGNISGGQREFIPYLVRAACACGVNAIFMEVHDSPEKALSDSNTVLDLQYLKRILSEAIEIHNLRIKLTTKMENLMSTKIEEILVKDVMINCHSFPIVNDRELLRETIIEMCNYRIGVACVVNKEKPIKRRFY